MLATIGMACVAQKVADLLHGDPQVSGLQQQAQPLSVNGLFWLTVLQSIFTRFDIRFDKAPIRLSDGKRPPGA